jgi:pilus assembly protein CpaB
MNPRQRRGVMMIVIAVVGAIAVFFAVLSYVNNIESEVGDKVQAWELTSDVPQYQPIPLDAVEEVEVPARWLPDTAVRSLDDLVGMVAAADTPKGTLLQSSTMISAPEVEPGTRAVTILVDAESGVAGKLTPGSQVDVWATFDGETTAVGPRTKVVAQGMRVLDVGLETQRTRQTSAGVVEPSEAVPVTFVATTDEIKALTFAESFALEVRLALRTPTDDSLVAPNKRSYEETFQIPGEEK